MRLLEHPVFANVDAELLASHLERLREHEVGKGDLVGAPDLRVPRFHLVLEGELASFQLTADGKRLLMEIVEPGGVDGMLLTAGLHGHFTEARQPSRLVSVSRPELQNLIQIEPQIAVNLLHLMLQRIEKREDQLDSVVQKEPSRRLARQLLALGEYVGVRRGDSIVLRPRLSHQALADMLGLRRETVTVHLNALRGVGAVSVDDHHLTLHRPILLAVVEGRRIPPAPSH
jgi:CRP-like cAMP-binding protein